MRIELPSQISAHTIENFLSNTSFFGGGAAARTLVFHPQFNKIEPFGIAMLAAWADWCVANGVLVVTENGQAPGTVYLQRMGLFDHLPRDVGPAAITHHDETGRFVALRKISTQRDLDAFVVDIAPMLHRPENIRAVIYCLSELTRNVLEHAGSAAYACAQHYPAGQRVAVGIADCGIGVRQSLSRAHAPKSDEEAIVTALKPGVSGTTLTTYGSADNAGLGLFYTRAVARASEQYFSIVSGTAAYRLNRSQGDRPLTRNPEDDKHKLLRNLPLWKGTVVSVDIGTSTEADDFDELLAAVGEVATTSTTQAPRIRPKIRFTP